jgi:hypothetical protein
MKFLYVEFIDEDYISAEHGCRQIPTSRVVKILLNSEQEKQLESKCIGQTNDHLSFERMRIIGIQED